MWDAVQLANTRGVVVVAAAGNEVIDVATDVIIPCETENVICVGSIDKDGNNVFNYGSGVDIWAPTNIYSTVTPDRVGNTGRDAVCCFRGTSASTPFVAGVVALMKALDPTIRWNEVQTILQETANTSDDPRVTPGYIDAFRAVERVKPNAPPTVNITLPRDGANLSWGRKINFLAEVVDPESPGDFNGEVTFFSDLDGNLCTSPCTFENAPQLSIGTHVVTALATDPFGATGNASITINVVNNDPLATIAYPPDGSSFNSSQAINLRGSVSDPDEEIPETNVVWTSNLINNPLGTGKNIWVNLTPGTHTISLTVTDAHNRTGQDNITLNVAAGQGHPTAQITSPQPDRIFPENTDITFQGSATDPEDGVLTGTSLSWYSDRDGLLGTGNTIVSQPSGIEGGYVVHNITLRAVDSDGNEGNHTIRILIGTQD
jgi:hypothetical protein